MTFWYNQAFDKVLSNYDSFSEQWEGIAALAWSWAWSDGQCAWSSTRIRETKPSVCKKNIDI